MEQLAASVIILLIIIITIITAVRMKKIYIKMNCGSVCKQFTASEMRAKRIRQVT